MAISQIQSASLASGVPASSNMPTGSVLQVVQGTLASYASTTSTTLVSTGLTATITPKFSTSKVLVMVNPDMDISNGGSGLAQLSLQIVRGATSIFKAERAYALNSGTSGTYLGAPISMVVLDSPATTSSTTYTLNWCCYDAASYSGRLNDYTTIPSTVGSTITLLEIAG